jgi:hypothetical protein
MHALYHVINLAFNNPPGYTIPKNLTTSTDRFQHNSNIEQVCHGVVHPITKETITKYTKLMDDPALKDLWVPAMSKELHCLSQGKEGVTVGTNTIFYLTHDEIRRIPKIEWSCTHKLSSTTAHRKTTQIKYGSRLAELYQLSIRTSYTHCQYGLCQNYVEQCNQYARSQIR